MLTGRLLGVVVANYHSDLEPLRRELAGTAVESLDEIRDVSPRAAQLLAEWLDGHGWWMLTGYDVDAITIGEMPSAVVVALGAPAGAEVDATPAIEAVLAKIPSADVERARGLIRKAATGHRWGIPRDADRGMRRLERDQFVPVETAEPVSAPPGGNADAPGQVGIIDLDAVGLVLDQRTEPAAGKPRCGRSDHLGP